MIKKVLIRFVKHWKLLSKTHRDVSLRESFIQSLPLKGEYSSPTKIFQYIPLVVKKTNNFKDLLKRVKILEQNSTDDSLVNSYT